MAPYKMFLSNSWGRYCALFVCVNLLVTMDLLWFTHTFCWTDVVTGQPLGQLSCLC